MSVIHITTPETSRRLSNRVLRERRANDRHELQLTSERDEAELAFEQVYAMIIGHGPNWSSNYGFPEAVQDIEESLCPSLRVVE